MCLVMKRSRSSGDMRVWDRERLGDLPRDPRSILRNLDSRFATFARSISSVSSGDDPLGSVSGGVVTVAALDFSCAGGPRAWMRAWFSASICLAARTKEL